ncbi:MAG: hypothetical protein ACR2PJ_00700 [Pseudomonadales bacterium]
MKTISLLTFFLMLAGSLAGCSSPADTKCYDSGSGPLADLVEVECDRR